MGLAVGLPPIEDRRVVRSLGADHAEPLGTGQRAEPPAEVDEPRRAGIAVDCGGR